MVPYYKKIKISISYKQILTLTLCSDTAKTKITFLKRGCLKVKKEKKSLHIYSQTCIKRSSLRQRKSGLLRQVTS